MFLVYGGHLPDNKITIKLFLSFQVYSINIPDLSAQCPLIIFGRCYGKFTEAIQAKGIVADMTDIDIDLKVHYTKDFLLEKVRNLHFAKFSLLLHTK